MITDLLRDCSDQDMIKAINGYWKGWWWIMKANLSDATHYNERTDELVAWRWRLLLVFKWFLASGKT